MEPLTPFLDAVHALPKVDGQFRGLLHALIGRRITGPDGKVLSTGLTWRAAASLLKRSRWEKDAVKDLGLDPAGLPPRDRERFWYSAIVAAQVDAESSRRAADELARRVVPLGFVIGASPSVAT